MAEEDEVNTIQEDEHGRILADDQHVDTSQLKLPSNVHLAGSKEASGEEDEEVLCKL